MDFEDFEFKPLTEGLGFHKKTPSSAKQEELPPPLEKPLAPRERFDFEPALDSKSHNILKMDMPKFDLPEIAPEITPEIKTSSSDLFSKTLPRTEADVPSIPKFNPRFSKPRSKIDLSKPVLSNPVIQDQKTEKSGLIEALSSNLESNIETQNEITKNEVVRPNKVDATIEPKYIEVAPSALSLFLDVTVISGLSILFTLGLVVATRIDIVPILTNVMSDHGTQIGVVLLVYSVSQLYLILSRSFFGQTLGEWSMDTQVGLPKEQEQISYIFKLISRTLVLTLTAFFILPLLSMIFGKDLAGRAASLKLYTK